MTSRGFETDRIESICELICASSHLRELLDGEEDFDKVKAMYLESLKLRREQMNELLSRAESPNPKYHCIVKHLLGAWWRSIEIFEATGEQKDYEFANRVGNLAASALSQYLGMKFENCSRCLFDQLLVKQFDTIKAKE